MTIAKKVAVAPPPTVQPSLTVPDDMLEITAQDAGLGVSENPADQILPLVTVTQGNTTVTDKRSPDYRLGAEPGSFWFRNDLIEFRDGVFGFEAIPIEMQTIWIEWGPTRGSGQYGRHSERPVDAELRLSQEDFSQAGVGPPRLRQRPAGDA